VQGKISTQKMESETQDSEDRRIDQNIIDESSDSEVELPPAPRAPNQTYVNQISNMDLRFDSTIPNSPPYSPRHFQGCSLVGNYELEKKIGEGTFGEVSLARHKVSKKRVALKRILVHNEREGMPITALREIRILKRLKHPNVIRLMEMAIQPKTKERGVVFMVFPYMHHDLDGILQNPLITLTPPQIKSYMQQMLLGLEHLHYHHILHRDIKSSNILIDNRGKVKIADFGLARPFVDQPQDYTNMVVTRWYRAPELLMGSTRYTAAIDIWAIGCVFGEMLKRRAIFPGKSDMEQLDLIWTLCGTPDQSWKDKSYLELPMFRDGTIQDYQGETSRKKTLGEKFPSIQ
jgi:serine/threonine-protein kinase BUR1